MDKDHQHIKNIYHTPEGYFDQLPGEVMQKIRNRKKKKRLHIFSPVLKIAAILLVILCSAITFYILKNKNQTDPLADINELEEEQIVGYLASQDISTYEVLAIVSSDQLPANLLEGTETFPSEITIEELDLEDVEYYLNTME